MHIFVEECRTFTRFRIPERSLYGLNSLYTTSVQFYLAEYFNARAPLGQEATLILVQIPLSLLLQKEVSPLAVRSFYMVVDPND